VSLSRRMAKRNRTLFLLSLWVFLVCNILALVSPGWALILVIAGFAALVVSGNFAWHRYVSWRAQAAAEERVEAGLKSVEDCDIFQDVILPKQSTKIDHLVLAPSGIFAIETMSNGGRIECSGGSWTVRGAGRRKGAEIQESEIRIKRDSDLLRRLVLDPLRIETDVVPIICFAGLDNKIRAKGATIVITNPQELPFVITAKESERPISVQEAALIRFEIRKYTNLSSSQRKLW